MRKLIAAALMTAIAIPATGQMKLPGSMNTKTIKAGTYEIEPTHTIVEWQVNHFGFNDYFGLFGDPTGTLTFDPAKPQASKLSVDIPLKNLVTASAKLNGHMASDGFLDAEKFPVAKFVSTHVMIKGTTAMIHGNLTLRGVTKPVTLNATFSGAGMNPATKKETIGFHATGNLLRSQFGMTNAIPFVGDKVTLKITAAFEKQ